MSAPVAKGPSPYKIRGPQHALSAGMAFGAAIRHGFDLVVELDAEGNYSASALLMLPDLPDRIRVRVVVEPPEGER